MIAALRYEWVRITTVRSTWLAMGFALLVAVGLSWLIAAPTDVYGGGSDEAVASQPGDWFGAFGYPLNLTAVIASVLAAQAIGQEYRFGIVRLTLTAFPQRGRVLVAKLTVVLLSSLAVVVVSYAGSWVGVALRGEPVPPEGMTAPDGTYFLRGAVFVALWALSAFGIAGIVRQTAVGIAVPIISGLIVEQILRATLYERAEWLVRILPWSTATRWLESIDPLVQDLAVGWAALALFAVWVLLLLLLQAVLFLRRDA